MISLARLSDFSSKWLERESPCSNAKCTSRKGLRGVRRNGFRIGDDWFCSPECFEHAAEKNIRALCSGLGRPLQTKKSRIPLGLLLFSRGILTKDQLGMVLDRHRQSGANVGDAAQQLGFATPEQVTAAVALQWSCPVFFLGEQPAPVQVHIPRFLLELHGIVPVHFAEKGRKLFIGVVSSVQYQILYTIEHMLACKVEPCFITAQEYARQLSLASPEVRDDELLFENPMLHSEMARIVRNYAVQLGTLQARIGKCSNYIWARLCGGKREMDLIFRAVHD
jgi:hypothetical protein